MNKKLTIRENEVVAFLAKGLLNKEIAETLNITVRTVDTHLYSIYKKLQVKNRIEALNAKNLKKEQTMSKQTAVQWLLQRFEDGDMYNVEDAQFIKHQALAMEKEQKKFMFDCGRQYQLTGEGTFTEVYQETYKGGQDGQGV